MLDAILNFFLNDPDPSEASALILALSLLFSAAGFIGSRIILSLFEHHADRRKYEYQRSSTVNTMRYERELAYTQDLSGLFMKLRFAVHDIGACEESELTRALNKWDKLYRKAAEMLGRSAPLTNNRSLSSGGPSCGIHNDVSRAAEKHGHNVVCDSKASISPIECHPSLYLCGISFLDQCTISRENALNSRTQRAANSQPLLLFTPEDSSKFDVSFDICKHPKAINGIDLEVGDFICGADTLQSEVANEIGVDVALNEAYKRFINCAFCRVRNSETGQRDARKNTRKRIRHEKWVRRLGDSPLHVGKYDRKCPYDDAPARASSH